MKCAYDAVVLGAGIVGAACALELSAAGMSVAVIEREEIGSGATGAAMGHIVVMDDSPEQFALTGYSQSLWSALAPELPSSVEYDPCGTIWLAADEQEMAEMRRKAEFYSSRGVPGTLLGPHDLAKAEPHLSPLAGGLLVASDAVLNPAAAARCLLEKARGHTCELLLGCAAVFAANGRVLIEGHAEITAPIIINATGAWAPGLTPGIAVRERKGHIVVADSPPGFLRRQLVELGYLNSAHAASSDSVAFNVQPRHDGQVLIGSSRQYGAEEAGIDEHIVTAMMKRACRYMPGLASLRKIRAWSGFRPATPDKLPLIGPTGDPSIFLATGHEGLGVTTSLATGRLLIDHLLGRASAIPLTPYLPSRPSGGRHSEICVVDGDLNATIGRNS